MAALLPRWIASGLIASLILATVYGWVRPALAGSGWQQGLRFGGIVWLLMVTTVLNWEGVFNLPPAIWAWWTAESIVLFAAGGIALGWVVGRLSASGR